jgi:hypothetical protein
MTPMLVNRDMELASRALTRDKISRYGRFS